MKIRWGNCVYLRRVSIIMAKIHSPAVAGQFYPADADTLKTVVDGFIDAVYVTGGAQSDLFYRGADGTAHGGYVDDKPHKLVVWTKK